MRAERPALSGGHRIIFVTGKGGVGKSSVAAATALQLARQGQSVLLVEFGHRSFYGPFLGLAVGNETVQWRPRIGVACWDVEEALREYITHYLVFKSAANKILSNTVMKALAGAAPSVSEIAILGKLAAPMLHTWYKRDVDVVVVDGYATGQFMTLLRAPRGLASTAAGGPMHRQTQAITKLLADPKVCEYRMVTLAEEMPVSEACEMFADILRETGLQPRLYCNRMLNIADLPPAQALPSAAPFLDQMQRIATRQHTSLERLAQTGAKSVHSLPMVPTLEVDAMLERLADALEMAQATQEAAR
jgi:anion-transporting  ArsA/GET3 family ATPase